MENSVTCVASPYPSIQLILSRSQRLIFSIALDAASGARSHRGTPGDQRYDLLTARAWLELAAQAERGLVDFITIGDSHRVMPAPPGGSENVVDQWAARLDAIMIACRIAPVTRSVGIVPMASTALTEPFLLSVQIATLDYITRGRGGWELDVCTVPGDGVGAGSRPAPSPEALHREAADHVEVVRRLWDSWDDDAEIRDAATNRFIDRERIHHVDFDGATFSVKGPSITPRPPQGQPIIVAAVNSNATEALALATADVVILTAADERELGDRVTAMRAAASEADRPAENIRILADVDVAFGPDHRRVLRDTGHGTATSALLLTGPPSAAADRLVGWAQTGVDGFRLRPVAIPGDLSVIVGPLSAELQRRGVLRDAYDQTTLRGMLGLSHPPSRYATA